MISRFFHKPIPIYVINTAFGMVLMLLYSLAVFIQSPGDVAEALGYPGAAEHILQLTAFLSCIFVAFSNTAAVSISIEGSRLWISKTLPVDFSTMAAAKVLLNLTVTVPLVFANAALVAIGLSLSPLETATFVLPVLAYATLTPVVGLLCNLCLPKLTWTTQTQAVKQSASVAVALLAMALALAANLAAYALVRPRSFALFSAASSAAVFAASAAAWRAATTLGRRLYARILD